MTKAVKLLIILGSIGLYSSALAGDPTYCDASSDPDECECPSFSTTGVDTCEQILVANITDGSDPAAIRSATNLKAVWDGNLEIWRVAADLRGAAGVIKIPSTHGKYADEEEFLEAYSELVGETMDAEVDDGVLYFEKVALSQAGTPTRLVEDSSGNLEWANVQPDNLVWAALSSGSGTIVIDGVTFFSFHDVFDGSGASCPGTDTDSFDSKTDGVLTDDQCSVAKIERDTLQTCRTFGPNQISYCEYLWDTDLETKQVIQEAAVNVGPTVRCKEDPLTSQLDCQVNNGFVTVFSILADIDASSEYFAGGTFFDQESNGVTEAAEYLLSFSPALGEVIFIPDGEYGICTVGSAERNGDVARPRTRDGDYDPQRNACQ